MKTFKPKLIKSSMKSTQKINNLKLHHSAMAENILAKPPQNKLQEHLNQNQNFILNQCGYGVFCHPLAMGMDVRPPHGVGWLVANLFLFKAFKFFFFKMIKLDIITWFGFILLLCVMLRWQSLIGCTKGLFCATSPYKLFSFFTCY